MKKISDIVDFLDQLAPPAYQEGYDNAGLIVGGMSLPLKGVLCTLDCTEDVVKEAIRGGCNLIVAHHPIVFKGLKSLTGKNYVERTILMAIKNDIAIYAIHTNLDHVKYGVNHMISNKLGLVDQKILKPKTQILQKLTVFVPQKGKKKVLEALAKAGAGNIGNYSNCSFQVEGKGSFKPNENANPNIGESGVLEEVKETRIEVVFPKYLAGRVLNAMFDAHPYEEVAYYLQNIENANQEVGAGMIGDLEKGMLPEDFFKLLLKNMKVTCIKHTSLSPRSIIKKVAVCGGAGGFLLNDAISQGADIFITSDYKYHEYFDADGKIIIADIGHFESEQFTAHLLKEYIGEAFKKSKEEFLLKVSEVNTNPVSYFFKYDN